MEDIRLLPENIGFGFTTKEPIANKFHEYRHEEVGIYHNYHFTNHCTHLPIIVTAPTGLLIDGFSPNMNKDLHIGHLRNLAVAVSLQNLLTGYYGQNFQLVNNHFVALLGCSLGVKSKSLADFDKWCKFVGYSPKIYYDVALPQDLIETFEGDEGQQLWHGPEEDVIVIRSDGRPLYSFYDLAFSQYVKPTNYITGNEQIEHFKALGLGDKHLSMGLVLGADGKKIKSRDGNALSADEALAMVKANVRDVDDGLKEKLAWNVLAWNFLSSRRKSDIRFNPEEWAKTSAPGMFISYTYARLQSALKQVRREVHGYDINGNYSDMLITDEQWRTETDVALLGMCSYYEFYLQQSIDRMDAAPLANYLNDLCRFVSKIYEQQSIKNGTMEFVEAIEDVVSTIEQCMKKLGMFVIEEIR